MKYVLEAWDGWQQGGAKWVGQCREGLEDCWEEGETDYRNDHYYDYTDDCDY